MIRVSAPGKLFLSGEWAVLEVGNPGIVSAVNKRVHVEVEEAETISVSIDDFGISGLGASFDGEMLNWERELSDQEREQTQFMKGAIETVGQYLGKLKPFSIRSWGEDTNIEIDGQVKKVGFGSSAASVVATIAGLLEFHGQGVESKDDKDRVYKLSAIAHYLAQGKVGSAFDVAASTYGGIFVYQRFDPDWLTERLESGMEIREIVEQEWPSFRAEPLEIPENFELLIGWTRESASTSAMVKQLNEWAETDRDEYSRIYGQIASLVEDAIAAWKESKTGIVVELIRKNEEYLRELGQASGVDIETEELRQLSELANECGGAGKLSGAGGGDCGIAVCFDQYTAEKINNEWKNNGFLVIDASVDSEGVRKERA